MSEQPQSPPATTYELTVDVHEITGPGAENLEVIVALAMPDRTDSAPRRFVSTNPQTATTDDGGEATFDLIPTSELTEGSRYLAVWPGTGSGYLFSMPDNDARLSDLDLVDPEIGSPTSLGFTDLADTPGAYGGHAGQVAVVNSAENALEFTRDLQDVETFTRTKLAATQIAGDAPITWTEDVQPDGKHHIGIDQDAIAGSFEDLTDTPDNLGTPGQIVTTTGSALQFVDPQAQGSADDNIARAAAAAAQATADNALTTAQSRVDSVTPAGGSPIAVNNNDPNNPVVDLVGNTNLVNRLLRVLRAGNNVTFNPADLAAWTSADGTLTISATGGGGGSATFLGLTDTPASFGTAGQVAAVNSGADGLEFVDQDAASGLPDWVTGDFNHKIPPAKLGTEPPTTGDVLRINSDGTGVWSSPGGDALFHHGHLDGINPTNNVGVARGGLCYVYDFNDATSDITVWYRHSSTNSEMDSSSDWSEWFTIHRGHDGGGGSTTFLGLTDTPSAFGTAGQVPVVNSSADGLVFADQSGSGDDAAAWAEQGNTTQIPASKLGGTPTGSYDFLINDDEDTSDYVAGRTAMRLALGWSAAHANRMVTTDGLGQFSTVERVPAGRLGSGRDSGDWLVAGASDASDAAWTNPTALVHEEALAANTDRWAPAKLGSGTADTTTFLRGDGTWETPPSSGGGDLETGLERVLNETGLSANRSGSAESYAFTIPGALLGERIAIHALFNITTAGASNGSIGNIWLSTSDSSHDQRNLLGEFRGRVISDSPTLETNNLGVTRPVIDQTGRKAVAGADYFSFGSSDRTLYLWVPSDSTADADVRFDLQLYVARYSGEQGGGGTDVVANPGGSGLGNLNTVTIGDTSYDIGGDYNDLLNRPIFKVSGESAIPTPSASNLGHRYQTDEGREYIIQRIRVAGVDRVVEFEAYPTTADGYQGAVNSQPTDIFTNADEGKWWLVRDSVDRGIAPFVRVDSNGVLQSLSSVPDASHNFIHPHGSVFYASSGQATADTRVNASSAVIYSSTAGGSLWALYRVVASSYVAGSVDHDEYVIATTDLPIDLNPRVHSLESGVVKTGTPVEIVYNSTNWEAAATASAEHGLGGEPTFIEVWAECLVADAGYAVGDRHADINLYWSGQVYADDTNISIQLREVAASEYQIISKASGSEGQRVRATSGSWKFVAIPYRGVPILGTPPDSDGVIDGLTLNLSGSNLSVTASRTVGADVTSGTVTLPSGGGAFDLHDDVATQIGTLAATDRFVVSDESEANDPNRYLTAGNLRNFTTATVAQPGSADRWAKTKVPDDTVYGDGVTTIDTISQSDYDNLATKDASTLYVITS